MGPELLVPIFGIVGTFSAVIVFVYMHYSSRNRERMALIEKDKDASIFSSNERDKSNALKHGILGIMIGCGIFMGSLIERIGLLDGVAAYFSMILILGGIGLTGFYFLINLERKKENAQNRNDDYDLPEGRV